MAGEGETGDARSVCSIAPLNNRTEENNVENLISSHLYFNLAILFSFLFHVFPMVLLNIKAA